MKIPKLHDHVKTKKPTIKETKIMFVKYCIKILSHLKAFNFDELFKAIRDEEETPIVVVTDITGVKPTIPQNLVSRFLILPVTLHHLLREFHR